MKFLNFVKAPKNRTKLIAAVFGALLILVTYFIIYIYNYQIAQSKKEVLNKLEAVTNSASLLINGNMHQRLANKYQDKNAIKENRDDSSYQKLQNTLQQIYSINNLKSPIYTVIFDSTTSNFEFIGTSSPYPYYRHTYKKFPQKLLDQFDQGGKLDMYRSENGLWLSAFAPIKNDKGETVALVQADKEFGSFLVEARTELFKNIAISLFFFLLISIPLYFVVKSILDKEEHYKKVLVDQHEEIKNQNEEIETQNNIILENNNKLESAKNTIEKQNTKLRNINEHLDQKVKQRTEDLKTANENLAAFLYRSSHDIMGPVSTIQGLTHLAKIEMKGTESLFYFNKIQQSTDQMAKIIMSINAIFTAKMSEAKYGSVPIEKIYPGTLVKKVVEKYFKDFKNYLTIKVEEHPIISNKKLLECLLIELINYQLLNLKTFKLNTPAISINWISPEDNECFQISIKDNAPAIPNEIVYKLNSEEYSLDEATRQPGMGFYAIKSAIKLLKGEIKINNNGLEGNHIILKIPQGNKEAVEI